MPFSSFYSRKQYLRLQKLVKKNGKKVDREITAILKEFAEILIHGEKESDQYFEYSCVEMNIYN